MSTSWSIYVIVLAIITSFGSVFLLLKLSKADSKKLAGEELDHEFDGIRELNNPLPRWWLMLFLLTFIFSVVYLVLYPGLGNFPGLLNWSSQGELDQQQEVAQQKYGAVYKELAQKSIEELMQDKHAVETGKRIYLNNCIACHGSDGAGSKGYPDLTDNDWLYGDSPEQVKQSIALGRKGFMPPLAAALGEQGIKEIIAFVRSLNPSSAEQDTGLVEAGANRFAMMCASCHGAEGTGNSMVGAPDLTDHVWLYGGADADLIESLSAGRTGNMPAHNELLDEDRIHILTAYVLSLSK